VKRFLAPLMVVALGVALLGACSAAPTASDKVCDARDDLQTSLDKVAAHVKAGDFSKARQGLPDVQKAIDQLRDTAGSLTGAPAKVLQLHIEALRNLLGNLNYVRTLPELKAGLAAVNRQVIGVDGLVSSTLSCR